MERRQDSERIEQEAARWLSSRTGDQWTEAQQSQLNEWLNHSTAHRIAFIRLEATWKRCARMIALRAGVPAGVIPKRGSWGRGGFFRGRPPETHPPPRGQSDPGKRLPLLAAVLAFGIASAIGFDPAARAADVPAGAPADTSAEASRSSPHKSLAANSAAAERRRASRRMAAIEELPLNISAQPLESALQQFAQQSGLQVLFPSDGAVMRRPAPAMSGLHTPPEALDQLLADTGLRYEYVNSRTVAIREGSARGVLSSHDGFIVFDDTPLADIVAEFNRYNRRKIFIEDPTLAAIRLGGNFRTDNTDAFLWLLQSGFPITVEQTEDKVVLR
ncbi:MAG: FecR domain-containing protein [Gammaproteobacteria bacterium]